MALARTLDRHFSMPAQDAAHQCAVLATLLFQDTRRLSVHPEEALAEPSHSENRLCAPARGRNSGRGRPPSGSKRRLHLQPRVAKDKQQLALPLPGDIQVPQRKQARLETRFAPSEIE